MPNFIVLEVIRQKELSFEVILAAAALLLLRLGFLLQNFDYLLPHWDNQ